MHEMALCASLLEIVADYKRAHGFHRVDKVVLEVGALGHVEPAALQFAFEATARGTSAEHARLVIEEVAGRAWCLDCAATVPLRKRGDACEHCGGFTLILQQGEELRLREMEVS